MAGPEREPAGATGREAPLILVVEDEPEIQAVVRTLLEDEGFTVESAPDGEVALEKALRLRPDLIMLDLGLPVMNGEDFAARLRAEHPSPPRIVVMTAAGTIVEKAARVGAAAYVAKPFDLDELVQTVRHALDGPESTAL